MEKDNELQMVANMVDLAGKILANMNHMSEAEYQRIRSYIYNRFDISLPYSKPKSPEQGCPQE